MALAASAIASVAYAFDLERGLDIFSEVSKLKCAQVELHLESCLMVNFLKNFLEKKEYNVDHNMCSPPQFKKTRLRELLSEAKSSCGNYGQAIGASIVETYVDSVDDLLKNKSCWGEFCERVQNDRFESANDTLESKKNGLLAEGVEKNRRHRRVVRARRVKTRRHKRNRILNTVSTMAPKGFGITKAPTASTKAPVASSTKAPTASTKAPIASSTKAPSSSTKAPTHGASSTKSPTHGTSSTKAPMPTFLPSKAPTPQHQDNSTDSDDSSTDADDSVKDTYDFNAPSAVPTITTFAPTRTTFAPTISKGLSQDTGSIEIRFEASITLSNLDNADVPTNLSEVKKMFKVLEKAILKFLPQDTQVRIISVGDVSLGTTSRRKLIEGVKVEFEVIVKTECETKDCAEANQMADTVYDKRKKVFEQVLTGGELVTAIQEKAKEEGITVLETVDVDATSFQAETMKLTVKVSEADDDDDNISSGNKKVLASTSLVTIAFYLTLI